MRKNFVLLTAIVLCISFTACKKTKKTVISKGQVTQSMQTTTTSTNNGTQNKSECITPPTTQSAITSLVDTSEVTQTPSSRTTTPKVTTKAPQKTVAPKVTQAPQTQKQLIVPTAAQCQVIENEVMRLVNQYRASLGRTPYGIENKITQGARIRAKECSTDGHFGHIRPNGNAGISVLAEVGYNGGGAGAENLTGFSNTVLGQNYFECSNAELKAVAQEMFNGWKASPDHNKNMINATCTKMGVGVYSQYETTLQGRKEVAFYGIQLFTLT